MPLSLFGPPTTNWLTEGRRRRAEATGPYDRAIAATRRDVETAARGASVGGGLAAADRRRVTQAVAPEVSRLRASQANALGAADASIRADIRAEEDARRNFGNQLFGGLAGIAGQALVPMISGLGGGGRPAGGGGGLGGALTAAAPAAAMANPAVGAGMGAAGALFGSAPGTPPANPPDMLTPEEEERRRREREAAMLGGSAPYTTIGASSAMGRLFR